MDLDARVALHAALADRVRLAVVDALAFGDLTPGELSSRVGVGSNLLAHHLDVLEGAGIVTRRVSGGDARRRYVTLGRDIRHLACGETRPPRRLPVTPGPLLFVCTHNSARSRYAAAAWRRRTGGAAASAGAAPSRRVHPMAVAAAAREGLDLTADGPPRGYPEVEDAPGLVVSVCDRAREAGTPFDAPHLHWSVPDPAEAGGAAAFRAAFGEIRRRIDGLATSLDTPTEDGP